MLLPKQRIMGIFKVIKPKYKGWRTRARRHMRPSTGLYKKGRIGKQCKKCRCRTDQTQKAEAHRTLHCYGWKEGACVTNRLFPKLYWCGRKTLFSEGSQEEGFPDVGTMSISAQMPSYVGKPKFISTFLPFNHQHILSSPFSVSCMWYVHMCICMFHVYRALEVAIWESSSTPLPPLHIKARSLSQTLSSPIWLVLLINLLWGIPSLLTSQAVLQVGYYDYWLSSHLIYSLSYLPSP